MLYYLTLLLYVLPTTQQVSDSKYAVVQISPGFMGAVVTNETPRAVEIIAPGAIAASGTSKADCEAWGAGEARKNLAKELKLKDYRQIKLRCDLRPVVY